MEKHFEGRDYRLIIMHSDLLWASERVPGGVAGDGQTSVRALVERENAARARGAGAGGAKAPIAFDDDAHAQLEQAGMTVDSVPAQGQWVRLRGAANTTLGGFARGVMDRVHPDIRQLAIRAADALRLDLAGVDLLIEDISRSWFEIGALVCEVNAQPDLGVSGPHVYGEILSRLLPGKGSIPIVVLLGAADPGAMSVGVARELAAGGLVVGRTGREGVWIGGSRTVPGPAGAYAGATVLMTDPTVEAAVVCVNDMSILRDGLPFERFDVLVVAGDEFPGEGPRDASRARADLLSLLKALVPMCRGAVLTLEETGLRLAASVQTADGWVPSASVSAADLPKTVRAFVESSQDP
ncbi:MAG: hypothetical protein JNL61_07910 [Rhizobiaceae bacterium]|nr:hypothetical protein [Rhizobiaceae bacterium]